MILSNCASILTLLRTFEHMVKNIFILYMHSKIQKLPELQQIVLCLQEKFWIMETTLEHVFKWVSFLNTCSLLSFECKLTKGQKWKGVKNGRSWKEVKKENCYVISVISWSWSLSLFLPILLILQQVWKAYMYRDSCNCELTEKNLKKTLLFWSIIK